MTLEQWAIMYGVSYAALQHLRAEWGMLGRAEEPSSLPADARTDEAAVQARARIEAATLGVRMWRNNVGALKDERGVPVRYGLCNDTSALNKKVKSGDLIGIRPVIITPAMFGYTIGQFVSRECKPAGWTMGADPKREGPQEAWAQLINSLGGDAKFTAGPGSF